MSDALFRTTSSPVSLLIEQIDNGEIALPDIQRPFVWTSAKVRELFDSMYRGFPVGYLLFWDTLVQPGAERYVRGIGTESKSRAPNKLIVDGQQRLTALYAVMTGKTIIDNEYRERRIRIAFRPIDGSFAVADAATDQDPERISDISEVFTGKRGVFATITAFLERLRAAREVDAEEEQRIGQAIDRLHRLVGYGFSVVELASSMDEERVAEVFVRINSQGVSLDQADFILTLMSVFWEEGRVEIEDFSRRARTPSANGGPSPHNQFITPDPDQLLRTAIGVAFRRGALRHVYSLLRGKNLETGAVSEEDRAEQFRKLAEAQAATLDLTNWSEYLKCLVRAGFRGGQMVSSETALMYCYSFWLIGRCDFGVPVYRLREVVARWFFMVHTTRRYTGSSESRFEQDLSRLRGRSTPDEFCDFIDGVIDESFTDDYWQKTFPGALDSSASWGPAVSAYNAALVILDARALFSKMRISDVLDPVSSGVRAPVERHHLFPKAHLIERGISARTDISAIANMAYLEWSDNATIGRRDPAEYFGALAERLDPGELARMRFWHALPEGWEDMEYGAFLAERRARLADVVRQGFERLRAGTFDDAPDDGPAATPALIAAGESGRVEFKSSARWNVRLGEPDWKMEHIIAKTIAGFMNAGGGTLIIGVEDDGSPRGLNEDFALVKGQDRDGYELFLIDLVQARIGPAEATLIGVAFDEIEGAEVCRVEVAANPRPVFVTPSKGEKIEEFWIRIGNSTRQLTGREMVDYQAQHWGLARAR